MLLEGMAKQHAAALPGTWADSFPLDRPAAPCQDRSREAATRNSQLGIKNGPCFSLFLVTGCNLLQIRSSVLLGTAQAGPPAGEVFLGTGQRDSPIPPYLTAQVLALPIVLATEVGSFCVTADASVQR